MADDSESALIAGRFAVDAARPLPDAGGGVPAFLAADRQAAAVRRVALAVSRDAPPRVKPLLALDEPIDNLMTPLAHGVAPAPGGKGEGYYVICTPPPGPPLSAALNAWPEAALLDLVLRPVARVLDTLQGRGLTHRAIRLNNVFQAAPGQPVTLGAAWAAPPAMHQPAGVESPYQAMCQPAGRGDGSIAEDVYSLGVLLLVLASGRMPLASLDDAALIRWKLDLGSFTALARDTAVSGGMSGFIADLVRGMLAEDPDHRPPPSLLLDPANARARRVAARPARRSQRPLMLGDVAVYDARTLGYALLRDDKKAIQALRAGTVTHWLRRGMGDATLAADVEEVVRNRVTDTTLALQADAIMLMRAIGAINPRMPLCWRGVALWPDALAALVAEAVATGGTLMAVAEELLVKATIHDWALATHRTSRVETAAMSFEVASAQQYLQSDGAGGLLRVFYALNPLLPCRSTGMAAAWIVTMADLMRFLERTAESIQGRLVDVGLASFIAARADRRAELEVNALLAKTDGAAIRDRELALLKDLQARYYPQPMPGLAKWAVERLRPAAEQWRNRPRRAALMAQLDALAQDGYLGRLQALLDDPAGRTADRLGAEQAAMERAAIDAELAAIAVSDGTRLAEAGYLGQAVTAAIGLVALVMAALRVLFP
jgi:hypothetical protein